MPARPSPKLSATILQSGALKKFPWLLHGFSTRRGGFSTVYGGKALNLGFTKADSHAAVERNRQAFLKKLGACRDGQCWPIVHLRQIHSDIIHCVAEVPRHTLAGDGLLTRTPGIVLAVQTADCLPIVLVDTRHRAVGVLHAGWRGTVNRIAEKGVGEMRRWFGTLPRDVLAAIGPGIHACCYEVGPEVREKFASQFAYADELFREQKESRDIREKYPLLFLTARAPGHSDLPKKLFLDLVEANRRQLIASGLPANNITASPLCTSCSADLLFSYRRERGLTGRLMGAAAIKSSR